MKLKMSDRAVLLSYGERNKAVKMLPSANDLSFLRNVVERTFLKVEESHGGANVYFQKYDTEWEEWVDVDEDFVAETKDKLKVVVTCTLVTDLGTVSELEENLRGPLGLGQQLPSAKIRYVACVSE